MDTTDTEVRDIILSNFSDALNPTEAITRLANMQLQFQFLSL